MRSDLRSLAFFVGLLIAGVTTAITIRYATFVPWGTDAAGYVGAARRWADGRPFSPAPFQLWAPWSFLGPLSVDSPLAYRRGPERGTDVSVYPLGLPVFLAVADKISPELGVYVVPPLFVGILVWCTFLLGRRLAGEWAGVLAALLTAASPVTLNYAITPMSDVPAAAFFLLALEMSLRRSIMSAAAAGSAIAAASMIRPILGPLAIIVGVLAIIAGTSRITAWREWRWKRAFVFGVLAAIGPLMVGWSQRELYGGFFASGHLGSEVFFSAEHITANLKSYPQNLMAVHTPVVFLGLMCAFVFLRPGENPERRRLAGALCAVVLLNYALYLLYLPYDDIAYLRFVLPALTAMFVLLAGVCVWLAGVARQASRFLAPLALVPAAIVIGGGYWLYPSIFAQVRTQKQVMLMGRYLRDALPPNAAVITYLQGGAIAHYTGRQIVRFDLLRAQQLEPIIERLNKRGYRPVLIIDQESEGIAYRARFSKTRYGTADWRPRAQSIGGTNIWYLDFADRDGVGDRKRAPIDVLN